MYKYPLHRENIFCDDELNVYNDLTSNVYKDLIYNENGVLKINISRDDIGYSHNLTIRNFVKTFILGIVVPGVSFNYNCDNYGKSTVGGKDLTRALKYRRDLLNRQTPEEIKSLDYLRSREFRRPLRKMLRGHSKYFLTIPQTIVPTQESFYIPDLIVSGSGINPLVIEFDGYYHFTESGIEYDKDRDTYLKYQYGLDIYRITNSDFWKMSKEEFVFNVLSKINYKKNLNNRLDQIGKDIRINAYDTIDLLKKIKSTGQFQYCILDIQKEHVDVNIISCGNSYSSVVQKFPKFSKLKDGKYVLHHSNLAELLKN